MNAATHASRVAASAASTAARVVAWLAVAVVLLLSGPLLTLAFGNVSIHGNWRTASHRPTGLAPDPAAHPEAIVQAYASRTFGWRGAFAVHTWVAAKPAHAERYTRYEVIAGTRVTATRGLRSPTPRHRTPSGTVHVPT